MIQIVRTPRQVGAALRRERRLKKLTQKQLGERVKFRQATVSKLESGEPATQMDTFFNVLTALDLEIVVRPRTKASPRDIEDVF